MKLKASLAVIGFYAIFIIFQSCDKDENETNISSHNESESHNNGQNCMTCHKSGGEGKGWFKVAGSIYDSTKTISYPQATIKLFSEPNCKGTLIKTIEVDKLGNFYTTQSTNLSIGIYPVVIGNSGTQFMNTKITSGQCNSCHGVSIDRMWVN